MSRLLTYLVIFSKLVIGLARRIALGIGFAQLRREEAFQ